MSLEEQIDKLTTVMERVAVALESGAGAATGGAATTTTAAKAPAKPKAAAKPKTTADQLKAKFAELKASPAVGMGPLKELITEQGCENLAELLVTPDKYDAAFAALVALEVAPAAAEEDEL